MGDSSGGRIASLSVANILSLSFTAAYLIFTGEMPGQNLLPVLDCDGYVTSSDDTADIRVSAQKHSAFRRLARLPT
jgi:hypothetical protein